MRGSSNDSKGIMPRCIEYLLNQHGASNCELWASYLQIYCETITDLLWQPQSSGKDWEVVVEGDNPMGLSYGANQPLLLREKLSSKKEGLSEVYVEGLSRYRIRSVDDLDELLRRGDSNRSTAATNVNETSSRSHAVLVVKVITPDVFNPKESTNDTNIDGMGPSHRESTLMMVDLAGSERASATTGRGNTRSEEARAINLSLSALGNCMSALAAASSSGSGSNGAGDRTVHVPYRDSKLTRVLQGCLGGGARTAVVVTLAPGMDTAGESLSALRFAARASKVKVAAKVNRVKDFEALYREAKHKLKEFQSSAPILDSSLLQQKEQLLRQRDGIIEQQALEIAMLKEQLQVLQGKVSMPASRMDAQPTDDSAGNQRTFMSDIQEKSGDDTVNAAVEVALAAANKQHVISLESAHRTYNAKLLIAQQAEQTALRELSLRIEDLKQERERSLNTMRQLREAHDKFEEEETVHKARTAEFLEEITTLREENEDLAARNEFLDEKIRSLLEEMEESVSKEQVREMENLFLETVSKLSDRVNMLEGGGGGNESRGSNASTRAGGGGDGSREVRMAPGGRIRAGQTNSAGNTNSGRGMTNDNGQNMQHSRSSNTVARKPALEKMQSGGAAPRNGGGLW